MTAATFQDRVVEFFTLREAARQIAAVPEETRASIFRDMRVAFQKREAAETLWPRGSTAEALKLASTALDTVTSSLSAFPEPHPAWLERARTLAADATKRITDVRLPTLESETQPAHEALFRALVDALIAIEEYAGVSLAAPSDLRRIRNLRVAATGFGVVVAIGLLAYWLHTPAFSHALASGQLADYSPDKAIDGDPTTPWLLPDHVAQGWLDLTLGKPRSVRALRVLASNPPWNDRDVKDARFDALLDGVILKSLDVTFPEPQGKDPNWNDVNLDAPKCDHIRITVKSNYKVGAGIAEVEIK
ncbi:MAG: discoidin domain-containing protein [Polyangiaceae bacterium]